MEHVGRSPSPSLTPRRTREITHDAHIVLRPTFRETMESEGIGGTMSQEHAFWVSGETWIDAKEDHLQPILNGPEQFGLSQTRINEVYAEHGQSVGAEGAARDELIREAAKNGWVRVRRYREPANRIVIQGYDVNAKFSSIRAFLQELSQRQIVATDDTVVLSDYESGEARTFRVRLNEKPDDDTGNEDLLEASE